MTRRDSDRLSASVALSLIVAAGAACAAHAQNALPTPPSPAPGDAVPMATPAEPDGMESRLIREVELRQPVPGKPGEPPAFGPLEPSLAQLVLNQLRSRTGAPYSRSTVTEDIERINRLARFRQVDARVQLNTDGSLRLVYTLIPQAIIADVQIAGNKLLTDVEISKEVDLLTGTPVDEWQIDRAARRIEAMYRERGYYLARVRVNPDELSKANVVLFEITEGERIRVMEIRFEGNKAFPAAALEKEIKTREAWLLDSGPLDDEVLDADVGELVRYYRDRGYLNARVDRSVLPSPDGREAIVTFVIDEDVPYTMRGVEVEFPEYSDIFATEERAREFAGPAGRVEIVMEGAERRFGAIRPGPLSVEQVRGIMTIKTGDVYSADKLTQSIKLLEQALGKLGYTDVQVVRRELRDERSPQVDVLIVIRGVARPYKVGEVILKGNSLTKSSVLLHEITLKPERPLDSTEVEETKRRLEARRLFNPQSVKVSVQEPDPIEPDHRDVVVEVEETNTGSVIFGAVAGSDGGLTGQISLRQRNFDIADTPDTAEEFFSGRAFRGAGQTFSIDLYPGVRSQTFAVSLSEPHLFESDYSGSGQLFYRSRDYREYDESRGGVRLGVGRRLGSRWNAGINFRGEVVDISDIQPDEPVDYFQVEDSKLITGVGITLTRSTFDDNITPSRGSRVEFAVEQVGVLGGDFDFTVLRAEHSIFFTLYEDFFSRRTTLNFQTRASYIPQSQVSVPVYERFFLGGQNFRGFGFRTISPRGIRNDTGTVGDDPVGGNFLFYWGAEIKQPIYEDIVSLVFFTDTGTVNEEPGFDNYRVSVGTGFRVLIRQLSPVPLAFDFGIPVLKEEGDRKRLFTFTVDIPF